MAPPDIGRILETCLVCPGVCTPSCPVHRVLRGKETSPNGIARVLYWWQRGWLDGREAAGECSLCWKCVEECPVENRLVEAIMAARKDGGACREELEEAEKLVEEHGSESRLFLITSRSGANLARKLLDSSGLAGAEKLGRLALSAIRKGCGHELLGIIGSRSIVTDAPCILRQAEKLGYKATGLLLSSIGPAQKETAKSIGGYVLHIPCWTSREKKQYYLDTAQRIYGSQPSQVLWGPCGAILYQGGRRNSLVAALLAEAGGRVFVTYCGLLADMLVEKGVKAVLVGEPF